MAGPVGRLLGILPSYLRIAWWGLCSPRLLEGAPLRVHQGVILGAAGLLLGMRRDLRGWELPGGEARAGETGEQAVAREVLEETGVRVAVERRVGDYVRSGFRPHVARVYLCRVVSGTPRPGGDTLSLRWFDAAAPPDTLFPWYRRPLADALAGEGLPVVRHEHQGLRAVLAAAAIDLRVRLGRAG